MEYFTIISGVASILGFIITIANLFPTHAKIRNNITIFAIGSFAGSLIGSVKNININFPENPLASGILVFYLLSLLGLFFIGISAVFSGDKEKRTELLNFTGEGFGILVIVGVFIAFFSALFIGVTMDAKSAVSQDELLAISDININRGNIDRAIKQLELFSNQCNSDDPRKEAILKKIQNLKSLQSKNIKQ